MKRIILVLVLLACQACLLNRFIPGQNKSTPAVKETLPSTATTSPKAADLAAVCRTDVDGIRALLDGLEYPQHLTDGDFTRHPEDFDPNQFFSVLTHLHMQPGYVLDYVAFQDGMGGKPLVYARQESDTPYASYDAFMLAHAEVTPEERSYASLYYAYDYLAHVQVDGSPESYLEYNLLAVYGDQWYLFWHSNYKDSMVLCDPTDLDRADAEASSFGNDTGLPADVKSAAKKLDFTPTVAITETGVTVRYVYFTKWGGFMEEVFIIAPDNPYTIINRTTTPLVEYNCGVMF
jgi:hypothetical protein